MVVVEGVALEIGRVLGGGLAIVVVGVVVELKVVVGRSNRRRNSSYSGSSYK